MTTEYIVMSSSAHVSSARRRYGGQYRNVAVVEVESGARPAMISERAKGVVRIVKHWGGLSVGKTERSQYAVAFAEADALANKLNEEAGQ
jgi:hypothetical protein